MTAPRYSLLDNRGDLVYFNLPRDMAKWVAAEFGHRSTLKGGPYKLIKEEPILEDQPCQD